MSDSVRVEFDPPRNCEETEKAWALKAVGSEPLFLPKSQTYQLHRNPSDESQVVAATVSRYIAEKESLVDNDDHYQEKTIVVESRKDEMSREDWFTLGAWLAVLFRGDELPVFEARKLAARLLEKE